MDISPNYLFNERTNIHSKIIKLNGSGVNFKIIGQKSKSSGSYFTIILEDGKFILH